MRSRSIPVTQRSFDDLGPPLHEVTFCVIDLETTGGDRATDLITEIGAVKVRGGECLGTFQTLVNPGRAIPAQVVVLTGIADGHVATAPRIEAVLPTLLDFIGDAVVVGHNVGFDLGFLRAACERSGHTPPTGTVIDTVALARRLVRDEVPDCRLSTLADRFRLAHRPCHRALDDALATTDLLHLLIERASGLGVVGLDDLVAASKLAGHPHAAKLKLTTDLPRSPGVYLFRGHGDSVLYVGKATNLRQRVRSYFGSDDRRKIGPLLRETQAISHLPLPDPLTAEIVERRLIGRLLPRYNKSGTRVDRYCYVKLDVDAPWPRLTIVKRAASTGIHLGPLPSRTMAALVIDAVETALPLRRCTARLGRGFTADTDAPVCSAAQLGVAMCPCAGAADPAAYSNAVDLAARALTGDPGPVVGRVHRKMLDLAAAQRFEEAAGMRDRLTALLDATRRHVLIEAMRRVGQAEISLGGSTWVVDRARLLDATKVDTIGRALPVAAPEPCSTAVLERAAVDEALCLARFCDARADRLQVRCNGIWTFPVGERVPDLAEFGTEVA